MTPKERAAMQQALEALENFDYWLKRNTYCIAGTGYEEAITALREALAEQAEQEPVGMVIGGVFEPWNDDVLSGAWEIYAAPVRTKDLTVDDLRVCFKATNTSEPLAEGWPGLERFARAVIAADREKNK